MFLLLPSGSEVQAVSSFRTASILSLGNAASVSGFHCRREPRGMSEKQEYGVRDMEACPAREVPRYPVMSTALASSSRRSRWIGQG